MKLSDAIRLGAMLGPQTFGDLANHDGGTCALRAGADAAGLQLTSDENYDAIYKYWPWLEGRTPIVPESAPVCGPVDWGELIWMLNDDAGWTREQIADWVATIEPVDPPQPETAQTAEYTGRVTK